MNKEFENQKQEIINALDEIFRGSDLRMHNQPPDVPNKVITIEDLSKGFNLLKQLQPPTPPTCSTCKYYERGHYTGDYKCYRNNNDFTYGCETDEDFGCTNHSEWDTK